MRREWVLLGGTVVVTLALALGVIRWLAPSLLGVAVDRQVVQMSDEVPPFYDGVFRADDMATPMIQDPYVGQRHMVLVQENSTFKAPFDLLGFRNRSIPTVADVVAIGDSQTVGVNAPYDLNWPNLMARHLREKRARVYNISKGGWGAVQYLYMFEKALFFRPRAVVVAFYTGNDPVDSVHIAYHHDAWEGLRALPGKPQAAPSAWPPKESEVWSVTFADGVSTAFTPTTRLAPNNRDYPATGEGYRIMAEVGRRIDKRAGIAQVPVVFTIIPTKEMAFARKVAAEGLTPPADYAALIDHEGKNIAALADALRPLPNSRFVDVVGPLQQAVLGGKPVYPARPDGHPVPGGYNVIAKTMSAAVNSLLPVPLGDGLVIVENQGGENQGRVFLVRDGGVFWFGDEAMLSGNGWAFDPAAIPRVKRRDLAGLRNMGFVETIDPKRYGPRTAVSGGGR